MKTEERCANSVVHILQMHSVSVHQNNKFTLLEYSFITVGLVIHTTEEFYF